MIPSIRRAAVALVVAAALLPALAGEAAAAVRLDPAVESPENPGYLCDFADRSAGYGTRNRAGVGRVYQLAYREADDRGMGQGVLYVHENTASWLKKQSGGWEMGRLLGEVVIGCGLRSVPR